MGYRMLPDIDLESCHHLVTEAAPCGCGFVETVGHHTPSPHPDSSPPQGASWCPAGCGRWVSIPAPAEPLYCSREHEQAADLASPAREPAGGW